MSAPIRVCMIVNNLDVGGLEKTVLNLLGALDPSSRTTAEPPRDEFELSLVCLKGAGLLFNQVRLPSERVLVLNASKAQNLGFARVSVDALLSLRTFLRARRVDIVHA